MPKNLAQWPGQVLNPDILTRSPPHLHVRLDHSVSTFNPLTLKSDQHLISPYNITPESHIKRIKKVITNQRLSWLLNSFSVSAPLELYREHYGECAYWCKGVKGKTLAYAYVNVILKHAISTSKYYFTYISTNWYFDF